MEYTPAADADTREVLDEAIVHGSRDLRNSGDIATFMHTGDSAVADENYRRRRSRRYRES